MSWYYKTLDEKALRVRLISWITGFLDKHGRPPTEQELLDMLRKEWV